MAREYVIHNSEGCQWNMKGRIVTRYVDENGAVHLPGDGTPIPDPPP